MAKKIIRLSEDEKLQKKLQSEKKESLSNWQPTKENKEKATRFRLFAALAWIFAILVQLAVIYYILRNGVEIKLWLAIVGIILDLAFAVTGGFLWKKSNKIDPPSEKNGFLFFMQSQLGLFIAIVAFLPLVIFIFMNKDLDKKQKGILGSIAVVALVAAGLLGTEFNPSSKEEYAVQTQTVQVLTDSDQVIGTKSGKYYHLYEDCRYIKSSNVRELFFGTVGEVHANNSKISSGEDGLCPVCKARALEIKGWTEEEFQEELKKEGLENASSQEVEVFLDEIIEAA
ncbi:MAG: hypothetical protein ACK5LM_03335 [Lactovum sp.]